MSLSSYLDNFIIRSAVLLVLPSGKTFYKGTTYSVYKLITSCLLIRRFIELI